LFSLFNFSDFILGIIRITQNIQNKIVRNPKDLPTLNVAKREIMRVTKIPIINDVIAKPNLYFGIKSHNTPTGTNPSPTRPKTCIIVDIGRANRS
jgi:hypothetical protein